METASFLVTGGCGLQGSHIVEKLLATYSATGASVSVMARDPTQNRFPGAAYHAGDITRPSDVERVFAAVRPTVVFHCAGLMTAVRRPVPDEAVRAVNVDGTAILLDACRGTWAGAFSSGSAGSSASSSPPPPVRAFVFTSSASVVQRGDGGFMPVRHADETWPTVEEADGAMAYPTSKAAAERLVLRADDHPPGLRTVALRPAVLYGERDNDITPGMMASLRAGRHTLQVGDNRNLFATTYAGNSADAHLLAAERLLTLPGGVAGEAFFVTNGADLPFWDFGRAVWRAAGARVEPGDVRVVPYRAALCLCWLLEWWCWLRGARPMMTVAVLRYSQIDRYYDISKARERLGYEPRVGLEEGVRRAVEWWMKENA